ncbi:hypothetical protein [Streptomyces sp. NPDC052015]|uniref:hypothetical protein n=1 Tax=Streptomyces sp. NPDC052015 TaxID=3154755 RepID=UPI00343EAA17
MGVLARLFRRSKATEEATTAGAGTEEASTGKTVTEETTAREPETTAEAPAGTAVDGDEADQAAEEAPARESAEAGDATEAATDDDPTADGVEIPRQQSSGEAADSEAGENART